VSTQEEGRSDDDETQRQEQLPEKAAVRSPTQHDRHGHSEDSICCRIASSTRTEHHQRRGNDSESDLLLARLLEEAQDGKPQAARLEYRPRTGVDARDQKRTQRDHAYQCAPDQRGPEAEREQEEEDAERGDEQKRVDGSHDDDRHGEVRPDKSAHDREEHRRVAPIQPVSTRRGLHGVLVERTGRRLPGVEREAGRSVRNVAGKLPFIRFIGGLTASVDETLGAPDAAHMVVLIGARTRRRGHSPREKGEKHRHGNDHGCDDMSCPAGHRERYSSIRRRQALSDVMGARRSQVFLGGASSPCPILSTPLE